MALFGDSAPSVPTAIVERFLDALEQERVRSHAVTMEALAIKRHEMQMTPAGWAPPPDPFETLGKKTQAAIERFAAGDRELRARLIHTAATEAAALAASGDYDGDDLDEEVATRILEGDS
jgi:hypothetical protein